MLKKETRINRDFCNCYICLTGRYFGHTKTDKGKGHVRDVRNVITATNGLYASSDVSKLKEKTQPLKVEMPKKFIKTCTNWFSKKLV